MIDNTNQIFNEEYTPEFVAELMAACLVKYPFMKDNPSGLRNTAISEERMKRYYAQPSEVISAHLVAQHDENKAKGWSTE